MEWVRQQWNNIETVEKIDDSLIKLRWRGRNYLLKFPYDSTLDLLISINKPLDPYLLNKKMQIKQVSKHKNNTALLIAAYEFEKNRKHFDPKQFWQSIGI